MTLHDKSTSADIASHIYAPPRYDDLPDPTLHPQEELAAGAGALLWCIAAAVVCGAVVWWVTG